MRESLPSGKKIYFVSDFHLGMPDGPQTAQREKKIVRWLDHIQADAHAIYLLGDLFDFWFEYKHVIPKGYIRLQGKLAALSDAGIQLTFFPGNHDLWMFDYFQKEMNAHIYYDPLSFQVGQHTFLVAHGDGLGPRQHGYKFIQSLYKNAVIQKIFAFIHPYLGVGIGQCLSALSRKNNGEKDGKFLGDDKEYLIQYCKSMNEVKPHDFYIFGHRHLAIDRPVGTSRYVNTGEWITRPMYAVYDGESLKLFPWDG